MNHDLRAGATLRAPDWDPSRRLPAEFTWYDTDTTAVSTSGPALTVSFDLAWPAGAGAPLEAVLRVRQGSEWLGTEREDYRDPDGILSVTAEFTLDPRGLGEGVVTVVPYAAFTADVGGEVTAEVAVHDASGRLVALAEFQCGLPGELQRNPDLLTVVAHTLVALVRASAPINRDEVRVIRDLLGDAFDLDDLGDHSLRRILKVANQTKHVPGDLAEVLRVVLPRRDHELFVDMLYDVAEADDGVDDAEQGFIDDLLGLLDVYDHARFGDARLRPFYEVLEVEPGSGFDEVKHAYRALVRDYHPDRVAHLAQGFQDFAHAKVKELNLAWSELRQVLK